MRLDYLKAQLTCIVTGAQRFRPCLRSNVPGSSLHSAPNQCVNLDCFPVCLACLYLCHGNNVRASIMPLGKEKRFHMYGSRQ